MGRCRHPRHVGAERGKFHRVSMITILNDCVQLAGVQPFGAESWYLAQPPQAECMCAAHVRRPAGSTHVAKKARGRRSQPPQLQTERRQSRSKGQRSGRRRMGDLCSVAAKGQSTIIEGPPLGLANIMVSMAPRAGGLPQSKIKSMPQRTRKLHTLDHRHHLASLRWR